MRADRGHLMRKMKAYSLADLVKISITSNRLIAHRNQRLEGRLDLSAIGAASAGGAGHALPNSPTVSPRSGANAAT